jgi:hypothetical protein
LQADLSNGSRNDPERVGLTTRESRAAEAFAPQPGHWFALATSWENVSRAARALLWTASGMCAALGCASSHFNGTEFRADDIAFRLEYVPPNWRRIEINDTALAFRDDADETTTAINGRCGRDAEDVPLRSLTQHLFLQFTDRQLEEQRLLPLDGREALETRMVARLDGVPKHFHVVVLKKDGCVYDFLQIANQARDPEQFLHFVRGFSTSS